jgi:hypothetical protein
VQQKTPAVSEISLMRRPRAAAVCCPGGALKRQMRLLVQVRGFFSCAIGALVRLDNSPPVSPPAAKKWAAVFFFLISSLNVVVVVELGPNCG